MTIRRVSEGEESDRKETWSPEKIRFSPLALIPCEKRKKGESLIYYLQKLTYISYIYIYIYIYIVGPTIHK